MLDSFKAGRQTLMFPGCSLATFCFCIVLFTAKLIYLPGTVKQFFAEIFLYGHILPSSLLIGCVERRQVPPYFSPPRPTVSPTITF